MCVPEHGAVKTPRSHPVASIAWHTYRSVPFLTVEGQLRSSVDRPLFSSSILLYEGCDPSNWLSTTCPCSLSEQKDAEAVL